MTTTIEDLPDNLLADHIVEHLSIAERCRWFGTNRRLFFALKDEHERSMERIIIEEEDDALAEILPAQWERAGWEKAWPRRMIDVNLGYSLHTLELNSHCSDDFLRYMAVQDSFPRLLNLSMRGSMEVTDDGLHSLSQHPSAQIETIDLTFCGNTTYAGTFCLRERYENSLKLLRRQPPWLDGHFHTPFGDHPVEDGRPRPPEIHTYYPDGTFSFTRSVQSRGFVMELEEWEGGNDDRVTCVADKLQYTNFVPQPGWPSFTEFSYRPGVCLFPLPDEMEEDGTVLRTLLVGQNLYCLRPTRNIHETVHDAYDSLSRMDIGTSLFFSDDDDGSTLGRVEQNEDTTIMISRMRVYPLEQPLPPEDLVQQNKRTCQAIQDISAEVIDRFELDLHEFFERAHR